MKLKLKTRNISIFLKVSLLFFIIISPIYITTLRSNIIGRNEIRREIIQSTNSKVAFYMNSIDTEMVNVMKTQNRLLEDEDLKYLSKLRSLSGNYEAAKAIWNVKDKLISIGDLSDYVEESYVYIPSIKKRLSSRYIDDINETEYTELKEIAYEKPYPFTYWRDKIFIIVTPYYFNSQDKTSAPPYIIAVEISRAKIQKVLEEYFKADNGGVALIGNNHGLNILNYSNKSINEHLIRYINNKNLPSAESGIDNMSIDNTEYIVSLKKSNFLSSTLIVYLPEEKFFATLKQYRDVIWINSILTLSGLVFFSVWMKRKIVKPLYKLMDAFKRVEQGELDISVEYKSNDEFGYLYKRFNYMCKRLGQLIKENYEGKIRLKNAELKQLQYQINPHFLYNSFFIIYRMAKMHDEESVIKLTHHLGNYYQFVTRSSQDEVPILREINHSRDYVEIQSIRFMNRIQVEFGTLPVQLEHATVPRLILQPLIENAYNHGLKNKLRDGLIKVSFVEEDEVLRFVVEDNGDDLAEEALKELADNISNTDPNLESTGVLNIHRRLQIRYGSIAGIDVARSTLGGLKIEAKIVLQQ